MGLLKSLFGSKPPKRVRLEPEGATFEINAGETVLEKALSLGIAFPHECTVGTCGSCRARLVEGRVDAITDFGYALSREELEAGYILACQAVAKTDLVIEVDTAGAAALPVNRIPARLSATEDLTHDIKRVTFTLAAPLTYRAGQYGVFTWPGEAEGRAYSFADAPKPEGRTNVSTFVRRVPGGLFSELLFGGGAAALDFTLEGPHGEFWLRDGKGPIICVAGGSGLAPLLSLLEEAASRTGEAAITRDCLLLFGARASRDLYAEAQIAALAARWPARFLFWPALSEEPPADPAIRPGLVTDFILDAVATVGAAGTQAYLCGPPAMIDAAITKFTQAGIKPGAIRYDKFTDRSMGAK